MSSITKLLTLAVIAAGVPSLAQAQWGSVTGRFVYKGDLPKPVLAFKKGAPDVRDGEVCAAQDFVKHDLVVDPKTKGIANIFVYIRGPKKVNPDLAPDVSKDEEKYVIFDQKACRFIPRCLVVHTSQIVKVKSDDPIAHNTHTFPIKNNGQNILIGPNNRAGVDLDPIQLSESLPFEVKCDFHAWMKAYYLVLDHPYAAVTQKDGTFTIKGLPAGKNEFRVWHERVGYIDRKFVVNIEANETVDVGAVEVDAAKFEE